MIAGRPPAVLRQSPGVRMPRRAASSSDGAPQAGVLVHDPFQVRDLVRRRKNIACEKNLKFTGVAAKLEPSESRPGTPVLRNCAAAAPGLRAGPGPACPGRVVIKTLEAESSLQCPSPGPLVAGPRGPAVTVPGGAAGPQSPALSV